MNELRAVVVEVGESGFQGIRPTIEILVEATPSGVEAVEVVAVVAAFEPALGVSCKREDFSIGLWQFLDDIFQCRGKDQFVIDTAEEAVECRGFDCDGGDRNW